MLEPNQTIYVKNIDWKIKKPLLRRALYSLFSRHGKVLELVTLRRTGLRGQAWVIMDSVQAANAALQAENGVPFFGKDLVLEYAKEASDRVAKETGTYVPKAQRQKRRADELEQKNDDDGAANEVGNDEPKPAPSPPPDDAANDDDTATTPPSRYLLAQNLPAECNELLLSMLFRQYAGYQEVRMPRPGLAFVEFQDAPHATVALQGLQGFKLSATDTLKLRYGKE